MSVRTDLQNFPATADLASAIGEAADPELDLAEGSNYAVASAENHLTRQLAVSIRASLSELSLNKGKSTWKPSKEAVSAILKQARFTALDGSAEKQGDLSSVVLHSLSMDHSKSTFPVPLGARISGVDENVFSSTGEAFSTVVLSNSESTASRVLQEDDVSLSYDFSKRFPGYTADNITLSLIHI